MKDTILQTKKAMKQVLKTKGLTRLEKFNQVKEKSEVLSEREREILLKEFKRDYESYDRVQDIKELIAVFLTGIGMLITVFGIFFEDKIFTFLQFSSILRMTGVLVAISVLVLSSIQAWRSSNLCAIKYMIDVLEEK